MRNSARRANFYLSLPAGRTAVDKANKRGVLHTARLPRRTKRLDMTPAAHLLVSHWPHSDVAMDRVDSAVDRHFSLFLNDIANRSNSATNGTPNVNGISPPACMHARVGAPIIRTSCKASDPPGLDVLRRFWKHVQQSGKQLQNVSKLGIQASFSKGSCGPSVPKLANINDRQNEKSTPSTYLQSSFPHERIV